MLQWNPTSENRSEKLIKYLSLIFDGIILLLINLEIDLLDCKQISWEDFSNYLISKASSIGGLMGGAKGGKKAVSNVAASSTDSDAASMQSILGSVEKIKSFSLTLSVGIPPKDKDKHKKLDSTNPDGDKDDGDGSNKKK